MKVQIVVVQKDGSPQILVGDPDCDRDPCERHGTCHCMCQCYPDSEENCMECAEAFGDLT